MLELSYKTRGNTSPREKPNVYFCCPPLSYNLYFESVSDEILAKHNCAFWYLKNPAAQRDQDFWDKLKQMNLFVMPVTSELLQTQNIALTEEFRFAQENHIPVLPLMQESGLVKLFNKKCGDIQFLDKYSDDSTKISYDESLSVFLSSVLVNDTTTETIRKEFRGHIFLSYRKADRKYAQELMKKIHKNEAFLDFSIWYDEFLTPGENFNQEIASAIQKCNLFALIVTPNLLQAFNYVMKTEYPFAKNLQKSILPVEFEEVNKQKLEKKYPEIPSCINASNDDCLTEALLNALTHMKLKTVEDTAEHRFYIGLAYLHGIGVEVNYTIAKKLIIEAANSQYSEAYKKLVQMYHIGLGVPLNYNESIYWQEKLLAYYSEKFDELSKNVDNGESGIDETRFLIYGTCLFRESVRCGDFYREVSQLDKAREKYQEAQAVAARLARNNKSLEESLSTSACLIIGRTYFEQGDYETALTYYKIAEQHAEKEYRIYGSFEKQDYLMDTYTELVQIYIRLRDLSAAQMYGEKCIQLSARLRIDKQSIKARRFLSCANWNFGIALFSQNKYQEAKPYLELALQLFTQLSEETQDIDHQRNQSVSANTLGVLHHKLGNREQAQKHFDIAVKLRKKLAQNPGANEDHSNLMHSYRDLAYFYQDFFQWDEAEAAFGKAIETISAIPTSKDNMRNSASVFASLGDIYVQKMDYPKADANYEHSLQIYEILISDGKDIQDIRDSACILMKLAARWELVSEYQKAMGYCNMAIDRFFGVAQYGAESGFLHDLFSAYMKRANVYMELDDLQNAKLQYQNVLKTLNSLSNDRKNVHLLRLQQIANEKIGDIFWEEDNFPEATHYYQTAIQESTNIAADTSTYEDRRAFALMTTKYSKIFALNKQWAEATVCCQTGLGLFMEFAEKVPSAQSIIDLALCSMQLGDCLMEAGDLTEACYTYNTAVSVLSDMAENDPEIPIMEPFAVACRKQAEALYALEEIGQATGFLDMALKAALMLSTLCPSVENLENLAMIYQVFADNAVNYHAKREYITKAKQLYADLQHRRPSVIRYQRNFTSLQQQESS